VLQPRANLRLSDDRHGQASQAVYTNPESPVGGLVTHGAGKVVAGQRARFSATDHDNAHEST
jgi:hypothetical protein